MADDTSGDVVHQVEQDHVSHVLSIDTEGAPLRPIKERRVTMRSASEHAAVQMIDALAVGGVALIASAVARMIIWIAQ